MNENDMSDEQLEEFEAATRVDEDYLDQLELLRRALNNSRIEQIYAFKHTSTLGPLCPYYKKARRLYEQDQQAEIERLLRVVMGVSDE